MQLLRPVWRQRRMLPASGLLLLPHALLRQRKACRTSLLCEPSFQPKWVQKEDRYIHIDEEPLCTSQSVFPAICPPQHHRAKHISCFVFAAC